MITRPPFEPPENGNLAEALRGRHGFGEKAIKGQRISLRRLIASSSESYVAHPS
ncbi:MAG TPA: hypothetical protein VIF39_04590 [Hyphomicrobium sp.]|jgi:hypothetical protein